MTVPSCPTTLTADSTGANPYASQPSGTDDFGISADPAKTTGSSPPEGSFEFGVFADPAKTTGSSPPELGFLKFPVLWISNAAAGDSFASGLQDVSCVSNDPAHASVFTMPFADPFQPTQPTIDQPKGQAVASYQAVKTGTGLAWLGISYLDYRSQFTRYYVAGNYGSFGSYPWSTQTQIGLAHKLYIPATLQGSFHSPLSTQARTSLLAQADFDMRVVGYSSLAMSGISLYFNSQVLGKAWDEMDANNGRIFFTATAADITATALHTTAPMIRSHAIVVHSTGDVPKAAALGSTSQRVAVAANLTQMISAGMILTDQVIKYVETGEWNYGILSFNLTKFSFGLSNFVRSVQALDDILQADKAADIYKISMGTITSEKWIFLKSVAKAIIALGLVANIYLLYEAIQAGDVYKITSCSLGLASNICFLIGIPQLAAGPLAPIGGTWCTAGYALIALQMIIDNRAYLAELCNQAMAIGGEAWQDLLTSVSDYDEVKAASAKPLHFLNLQRAQAGLPAVTANDLLAGLAAFGTNVPPNTDDIVGEHEFYNFRVLKAFTAIENRYLRMIQVSNGQVSESDRISILTNIYDAYQNLSASPQAQGALLALFGQLILENQKFATAMAASEVGQKLQKHLKDNFYVHQFKTIFLNENEGYFDYVAKTKLRTQAWSDTKSWMGEQVNTYFTDVWTIKQQQIWGDQYLAYWNKQQVKRGFDTQYDFFGMIAQMKTFGVDRFDDQYAGDQNDLSVRMMSSVRQTYWKMIDEVQTPSEETRLDIAGRVYNMWAETLRGNPEAQAAYLVLLEPVLLTNPRYKTVLTKYGWGVSLTKALNSETVLAFKRQLGIVEKQPMLLAYNNGAMSWSLSPSDSRFTTLTQYGAKVPVNLDMAALQRLDTRPETVTQNWQTLYDTPPTTALPGLQDGDLARLLLDCEALPKE